MFGRHSFTFRSTKLLLTPKTSRILVLRCKQCAILNNEEVKNYEQPFLWCQIPQQKQSFVSKNFLWSAGNESRHETMLSKRKINGLEFKVRNVRNNIDSNKSNRRNLVSKHCIDKNNPGCATNFSNDDSWILLQQQLPFLYREYDLQQLSEKLCLSNKSNNELPESQIRFKKAPVYGEKIKEMNSTLKSSDNSIKLFNTVTVRKTKDKNVGNDPNVLEQIADQLNTQWLMFFKSDLDLSLFSTNIYFENTLLKFRTRGLGLYRVQVLLFKWATKMLWMEPSLQILQSTKHFEDSTIRIRWQVVGTPRILYPMLLFGRTPSIRYQDFFSVLHIEDDDKITFHHLSKVIPNQRPKKRNPLLSFLALLGLSGTKMHIPELQEEPIIPSSSEPS